MNWYYVDGGQQAGPVTDLQLQELARTGKITPETLVWKEGMANWEPYSVARPPATSTLRIAKQEDSSGGTAQATTEAVCAECGGIFNTQEMIRYGTAHVCSNCKPIFLQKLSEGARVNTGRMQYAGFWIRFVAKFVDGLILMVVLAVPLILFVMQAARNPGAEPSIVMQLGIQLLFYAFNAAYTIFFIGKYGATPGKMACKLMVVTAEGGKVSYGRAAGRFFAEILSGMICYIGYIIAGFDDQKRSLHDHICSTRVIYK